MDLTGDVKLKDGDRSGQAEHGIFRRASQTATLTGQAVARDVSTETHAPQITFAQNTGEIIAEAAFVPPTSPQRAAGAIRPRACQHHI